MFLLSDKAEKIGPKIAAQLGKEMGLAAPPPYSTAQTGKTMDEDGIGDRLRTLGNVIAGGSMRPLHIFDFQFQQPRPFAVRMSVMRGSTISLGIVFWVARLSRAIATPAFLEEEKILGTPRFKGDPAAVEKLNGDKALVKAVNGFVRTKYQSIHAPRSVRLEPSKGGTLLTISSLPRPRFFGTRFDPMVFLDIANRAEKVL